MKVAVSLFSHYQRYGGAIAFLDLETLNGNAFIIPGSIAAQSTFLPGEKNNVGTNGILGLDNHNGRIFCCQWSRILIIQAGLEWPVANVHIEHIIDNEDFNDLHDLKINKNKMYVSSSGSETGFVLNLQGDVIHKFVLNNRGDVRNWLLQNRLQFNKIASTKPHPLHLNSFIEHKESFFATVLYPGEIVAITGDNNINPLITGLIDPHDCFFLKDTDILTVNNSSTGELQGYSLLTTKPEMVFTVQLPTYPDNLSWTRGIVQVSDQHLLIGLSVPRTSPSHYWPGIALVNIHTEKVETVYQFNVEFGKALAGATLQPYVSQFESAPVSVFATHANHLRLKPLNYAQLFKNKLLSEKNCFRNINIYSLAILDRHV